MFVKAASYYINSVHCICIGLHFGSWWSLFLSPGFTIKSWKSNYV